MSSLNYMVLHEIPCGPDRPNGHYVLIEAAAPAQDARRGIQHHKTVAARAFTTALAIKAPQRRRANTAVILPWQRKIAKSGTPPAPLRCFPIPDDEQDATMTDHDDHLKKFWDRLEGLNSGMLGLMENARLVPMSHQAEAEAGKLWFITAKGTDLARALAGGDKDAVHVVSDEGKGLFARIHGTLALSDDRAKLDELWSVVASSWFKDGKQDEDVQLLRFDLAEAEVWVTGGSLSFIYQIAKSKVTGDEPDMGEHFTLSF